MPRTFGLALVLSLGLLFRTTLSAEPAANGFIPLFNGTDLSGWVNVNCAPETFSVRDGMIVSTGEPTGVMRTTRMYENFTLELEFMHQTPGGNAGVFVWGDAITARGQPFVRAVEIQVLQGNHGDMFPIHGARMTPTPESPTPPSNSANSARVSVIRTRAAVSAPSTARTKARTSASRLRAPPSSAVTSGSPARKRRSASSRGIVLSTVPPYVADAAAEASRRVSAPLHPANSVQAEARIRAAGSSLICRPGS